MDTLEYDKEYWNQPCPKISCKKDVCKCGLKKVVLAAALGDDSKTSPIAPKNGAYCNAIVAYEANGNIYIYSSDGVPTLVRKHEEDVEAAIYNLQKQIDDIKNSPDVVDIVATYADLQAYDTSKLGDNDIIRVLVDEMHDDESTYYRWDKDNNVWIFIGGVGPYYTKAAADAQFVPQTRTVNGKALSSNITLNASDVNALSSSDVVQTAGSSTTQVMSQKATTDALGLKLNISDYVVDNALADSTNPVQNKVLYGLLGNMPSDFFTGPVTVNGNGREITLAGTMNTKLSDVKMYGDTFQQTYSGKNLFDKSLYIGAYQSDYTELYDGIKVSTTVGGNFAAYSAIQIPNSDSLLGKTVTLKIGSKIASNNGSKDVVVYQSRGATSVYGQAIATLYGDTSQATFTFPANYTDDSTCFAILFYCKSANVDDYTEYKNIQLEVGSTATTYEPYVGGTASPNPDYPQAVQTVTGEQTVTISDGVDSENFTISLGSIELCKIGDYQDYIYKSGDDWYVHKETGKYTLVGSETWNGGTSTGSPNFLYAYTPAIDSLAKYGEAQALCDYLTLSTTKLVSASEVTSSLFSVKTTSSGELYKIRIIISNSVASTINNFKTWLSTHNMPVYYVLATPTDTKITNSTLIGELEALRDAYCYDGTTILETSANALSAILDVTAFKKTLAGMIGAINRS